MSVLMRLAEHRSLENPAVPLSADDMLDGFGLRASSGVRISRESALTYSPWWRAITLLARDVAKLPAYVQRREGRGRFPAPEHPAYRLLRYKPNEYMTAFQWKQVMQGHAVSLGNGYSLVERDGAARPQQLLLMDPERVTPVRANGVLWYVYTFADGSMRKLPATDVLHIKGYGYDGLVGYSLIAKARETLGGGMAMQTYGSIFFRNSARPSVVLQTPSKLKPEAVRNLRESWERLYSGLENAHRTAVLEEGLQAKTLTMTARDAQLTDQEKFKLVDVANFAGIPVHKIGGEGRTSYNSLEHENQSYLDDGLDPWLVSWEEECRDKLLSEQEKEQDTHLIHFDRRQLIRANLAARGLYYVQALSWGWMSVDQVREEEGDNPLPGGEGNVTYRPLNMEAVKLPEDDDEDGEDSELEPMDPPGPGAELLDVPGVPQPDEFSCGAACSLALGQYFKVGPAPLDDWKAALGTSAEKSTRPAAIAEYLSSLGLSVTTASEMEIEDLERFWKAGAPVICPVTMTAGAGHYVVVVGVGLGQVFVMDPALPDPCRALIAAEDWLAAWHDADSDGREYVRFGIAVSDELPFPEPEPPPETETPPAVGKPPAPAPPKPAAARAFAAAAAGVLKDAVRRMVRRVGTQAERAANTPAHFCGWLDSFEAELFAKAGEGLEVAERACTSLGDGRPLGVGAWLLGRMKEEFAGLADRATAKELPGAAAAMTAELCEKLAAEAVTTFLGDVA